MNKRYEELMLRNGVKPTAIRLLVYDAIGRFGCAFNLLNLEEALPTIDKSTLFRTLTLFHDHYLIHTIEDGSGSVKYSLCHTDCTVCHLCHQHAHFVCTVCHRTFCLEQICIPIAQMPAGFEASEASYVVKGICANCSKK